EEMIGQPGSPNLYWALTDLPHPLLDLRKGIQGERLMWKAEFTALLDPYAPVSPATRRLAQSLARPPKRLLDDSPPTTDEARLQKTVGRVYLLLVVLSPGQDKPREEAEVRKWLEDRARDDAYMKAARKRLAERGLAADKLRQLAAWQVVLHNEVLAYEDRNDEAFKAVALPYWEAAPILERLGTDQTKGLFGRGANYVEKVRMAQTRVEQRLALLRVVEALRLHAAEHGGTLPAKLADVKLPLPVDPVTGRPFAYELKDGTAVLRGTPPKGMEKVAVYNVRYEVSIAK
ncbi:MAG TPA: hypothetical protein VFA26_08150, partial [Gemmataceae bacterium]|nr:hypothetical protein [Gemmataceae bacterium]